MKHYKYNLLGYVAPPGYRFLTKKDFYDDADIWWEENKGLGKSFLYHNGISSKQLSFYNYPVPNIIHNQVCGYVRKIS